jgi:hypothetical protein
MKRVKDLVRPLWQGAATVIALGALVLQALVMRVDVSRRRSRRDLPRVVWGPTPIINIKYWSQSLRQYGFASWTLVYTVYPAFRHEDFDLHLDNIGPRTPRFRFLAPYFAFAWCLRNADVFAFFFDGGYLANTPLRWLECQLMKLAGKRTILMSYGSDIAVPGTLGPVEAALYQSYPELRRRGPEIRRRVLYFEKHADFVVRCYQPGFQTRQDLLWPNCSAIDTEHWKPIDSARASAIADARHSEVLVVHPTNHRAVKGTHYLIDAVKDLQGEGLKIRLEVLERRSNEDVRRAMASADIVGEQFIAGFGLTAVEAMALGRPVLSNLSWLGKEFRDGTTLGECPIVDTSPERLRDDLRRLATNPELRASLGRAGREYVLKYHSAEAVGQIWKSIVSHVWLHEAIASKVSAEFLAAAETA